MYLFRIFCIAMLGLLLPLSAAAQPAGAKGDDFLYRIVQGDTLGDLAQRYTMNFSNWSALQRINGIDDPLRVPIAKLFRIPFSMIPLRPAPARVLHWAGQAAVDGRPLSAASEVSEGQTIETGPNGFVTLQLADDSIVSVPPSTSLAVKRLREFVSVGLTDSVFEMNAGSVETRVAPEDTGVGRFEVRTPVSVTGVRGTRLRVHASSGGSRSEVISGTAGVDGTAASEVVLQEREGVAVDREGKSLGVRKLLPAPRLAAPVRGPGGWMAQFEPVPGAASYLVSVAKDPEGGRLVSRQRIDAPPARFAASGPGTHYVFVRALDEADIGGLDARGAFEGAFVLLDGSGGTVLSGDGGLIFVADY